MTSSARVNRRELSSAQARLWFLNQLAPGGFAYTIVDAYRMRGPLEAAALERGVRDVIARHDVLRMRFVAGAGRPVAILDDLARFPLEVVDLTAAGDPLGEASRLVRVAGRHVFDLAAGPLLLMRLLRLAADDHILLMTAHHAIFDGRSASVFARDLSTAYRAAVAGRPPDWTPLPAQYADLAAAEARRLTEEWADRQGEFWRTELADAPPALDLPTDRVRPPLPGYGADAYRFALPADVVARLRNLAREVQAPLFAGALAVYAVLLARHTGTTDLVIGVPAAGRDRPESNALVGFFVNSLPLRIQLDGQPTLRDLIDRVRLVMLAAFAHRELPFERIVRAIDPPRDLSRNPVMQVWFDLTEPPELPAIPGIVTTEFVVGAVTSRFDVELQLREADGGGLDGELVYATDLFTAETVARLGEHYCRIAAALTAVPDRPVWLVDPHSAEERRLLVDGWATARPAVRGAASAAGTVETVADRFRAQVARSPGRTALVWGEMALSYDELNARANRLAHLLCKRGVGPESVVGVLLGRGIDVIVSVLAVIKAGAAYLPLDPDFPADRLAFMLRDSAASVVITTGSAAAPLPDVQTADIPVAVVRLDQVAAELAACPDTDPDSGARPDNLLYIIYTSGSTGRPKAVAMSHLPLLNLLDWQLGRSRAALRTLQFSAISFDISFQEMFAAWLAGGTLVLVGADDRRDPAALLRLMTTAGVQRLFCPPMVLDAAASCLPPGSGLESAASRVDALAAPPLRQIITAGQQLQITPDVRRLARGLPGLSVDNQYGPTEAHVVTAHLLTGDPESWPARPPIGRPLPNVRVYVLDRWLEPAPVGVPGEICIGGVCLARGYRGRPDLTADRFIPDPYAGDTGARMYRTGDLGRWSAGGVLEFLGRLDDQVKILGYRIEPGEIESVLREHPDVSDVAVVPVGGEQDRQLAAYIAPSGGGVAESDLRAFLRARLPEYMVPAYLPVLDALPLTPVGKLDRAALPDPRQAVDGDTTAASPQEQVIAAIWAEVLGRVTVSVDADFFDIGGHSLLATRVMSRVRQAFGVDLPLRALFEGRTVAGLAERIEAAVLADIEAMSDEEVARALASGGPGDPR